MSRPEHLKEVPLKGLTEGMPVPRERRPARCSKGARGRGGNVRVGSMTAYKVERARLLSAFGAKLLAERERRNVSQETLARIAKVHRTQIIALEGNPPPRHQSL